MSADKLPYTSFYSAILRTWLAKWDGDALKAFVALCGYCDERGVCFPGVRQLAEDTSMSIDRVYKALEALERDGATVCIRRDAHDAFTGLQLPNVYALHPQIVRVAQAPESVAFITLPIITKSPDRNYGIFPIHNQNHLTRIKNQNQEEAPINQNQEAAPPLSVESRSSASGAVQDAFEYGSDEADTRGDYANEGRNESEEQSKKQRSAQPEATSQGDESTMFRRAEPRSLRRYAEPLAEDYREQRALELCAAAEGLSLPNARMLVDIYPASTIQHAMRLLFEQTPGFVRDPARWLRKMIRRVDSQDEEGTGATA